MSVLKEVREITLIVIIFLYIVQVPSIGRLFNFLELSFFCD